MDGQKAQLRSFTCLGCPAEARPYRPHEHKLDSKTVSCYFVGYPERSRGFKFYDPTTRSIFETNNARFFEKVEFGGEDGIKNAAFEEEAISLPFIPEKR